MHHLMARIKNKKTFGQGLFFLLVFMTEGVLISLSWHHLPTSKLIKGGLILVISLLLGIHSILRSLDSHCALEDQRRDDEREKLLELKSKSTAFNISMSICAVLALFFAIMIGVSEAHKMTYGAIFLVLALFLTVMFFTEIGARIYHEKRN